MILFLRLCFIFIFFQTSQLCLAQEKKQPAYIFIINDFHGFVVDDGQNPGIAKLTTFLSDLKKSLKADLNNSISLMAGDNFHGQPISNYNRGALVSKFAKKNGITLSAIGNHEFEWDMGIFKEWERDSNIEFINGNVYQNGSLFNNYKKFKIVHLNGYKVAFIGLTTAETMTMPSFKIPEIKINDPAESAAEIIPYIKRKENPDLIIALTHIPGNQQKNGDIITYGKELTKLSKVQDIDIIINAHSHEIYTDILNGKHIIQAGYHGKYIGLLKISKIDQGITVEKEVIDVVSQAHNIIPNPEITELVKLYKDEFDDYFEEEIGYIEEKIYSPRTIEHLSGFASYLGKKIYDDYNLDCFIMNGGSFRESINIGKIKSSDIYSSFPYKDKLVIANIDGRNLKKILSDGILYTNNKGMLQFYGIKATFKKNKGRFFLMSNGKELQDNLFYKIALGSHMIPRIDNLDFSSLTNEHNTQIFIRDYFVEAIRKDGKVIIPKLDYLIFED